MSLLTLAHLLDKYGPILTVPELAQVLKRDPKTIRNRIAARTFELPTHVDGERVASAVDVAAYLDAKQKEAA
jgi:hypothetical protein